MSATTFRLGVLLVDDDPDILDQHKLLISNRAFRRQTPGRLYMMLRDAGLLASDAAVDARLAAGRWPTKKDLAGILQLNPEVSDPFAIVEAETATDADEAARIWESVPESRVAADSLGCFIAILDYDMPGMSGLELAEMWRPLIGGVGPGRVTSNSPQIVFYTGKAPLLERALAEERIEASLGNISVSGLAEAVLLKGALRNEFNEMMWGVIERRVRELAEGS